MALHAFSPSGQPQWRLNQADHASEPPAIGPDGTVYFATRWGHLYAASPAGSLLWMLSNGVWMNTVAIDGNGILYVSGADLVSMNPDGTERWKYPGSDSGVSPVSIASDGSFCVGLNDGTLRALHGDRTPKWELPLGGHAGRIHDRRGWHTLCRFANSSVCARVCPARCLCRGHEIVVVHAERESQRAGAGEGSGRLFRRGRRLRLRRADHRRGRLDAVVGVPARSATYRTHGGRPTAARITQRSAGRRPRVALDPSTDLVVHLRGVGLRNLAGDRRRSLHGEWGGDGQRPRVAGPERHGRSALFLLGAGAECRWRQRSRRPGPRDAAAAGAGRCHVRVGPGWHRTCLTRPRR